VIDFVDGPAVRSKSACTNPSHRKRLETAASVILSNESVVLLIDDNSGHADESRVPAACPLRTLVLTLTVGQA
jgi:hypothetical protein